jgi:hypothetical protein
MNWIRWATGSVPFPATGRHWFLTGRAPTFDSSGSMTLMSGTFHSEEGRT